MHSAYRLRRISRLRDISISDRQKHDRLADVRGGNNPQATQAPLGSRQLPHVEQMTLTDGLGLFKGELKVTAGCDKVSERRSGRDATLRPGAAAAQRPLLARSLARSVALEIGSHASRPARSAFLPSPGLS